MVLERVTRGVQSLLAPRELRAPALDSPGGVSQVFRQQKAPPRRGTAQLLRAYSEYPWLRAITSKIAGDVAATTWQLFAVRGSAGKAVTHRGLQRGSYRERRALKAQLVKAGALREIDSHPMLDLIDNPNPEIEGVSARRLTQLWFEMAGEAHWILEPNGRGMPVHAWPIPPTWVESPPSMGSPNFILALPGWRGEVPESEVLSFIDPDPVNPYRRRGTGIMHTLGDELETDEYAAGHLKDVFYNRARPDMFITLEGLSKEELDRYAHGFLGRHQGPVGKRFRPEFVNVKVSVAELQQNLEQLGVGQVRKDQRDILMHTIGVPPEIFGIVENSNRATIEVADYVWDRRVIVPRLETQRAVLQERLAPMYDARLIVDYVSPVQDDKSYHLDVGKAAPWALMVDEWREMAGQEELPDGAGKVFMVPFNLVPSSAPADAAAPAPAAAPPKLVGAMRRAATPIVHQVADRAASRMTNTYVDIVERHQKGIDLGPIVAAITAGNAQAAEEACDTRGLAEALWGSRFAQHMRQAPFDEADGVLLHMLGAAFVEAALLEAAQLDALGISIQFDAANPHAVAWASTHGAELVTSVSDGTRAALRAIIERAIEERVTPDVAAREIRDVVGLNEPQARQVANLRAQLADDGAAAEDIERQTARLAARLLRLRAETIARSELLSASNAGQHELWKQGVREGQLRRGQEREWLDAQDNREDDVCAEMHGATAKIGEPFDTPLGPVDAPPLHPNCRCAMALVIE